MWFMTVNQRVLWVGRCLNVEDWVDSLREYATFTIRLNMRLKLNSEEPITSGHLAWLISASGVELSECFHTRSEQLPSYTKNAEVTTRDPIRTLFPGWLSPSGVQFSLCLRHKPVKDVPLIANLWIMSTSFQISLPALYWNGKPDLIRSFGSGFSDWFGSLLTIDRTTSCCSSETQSQATIQSVTQFLTNFIQFILFPWNEYSSPFILLYDLLK